MTKYVSYKFNHNLFSPLNYINLSPPKIYKDVYPSNTMKVLKVKSRNYNGKQYYKYRVNLPEEVLQESEIKEGDELDVKTKKGEIHLKKK